jgi:hypothetical protein
MDDRMNNLYSQIRELLDEPEGAPARDTVERTLTDGYAQALALEAERWRLERRIGEVASMLTGGNAVEKTKELSGLAKRLSGADGDLTHLRGMLVSLRQHHESTLRAAS